MTESIIRYTSSCTVKPSRIPVEVEEKVCHLTGWDLNMLSFQYIQRGLFFNHPPSQVEEEEEEEEKHQHILDSLKDSLASTLDHFPPLAGRLVTQVDSSSASSFTYIDCNGAGAQFIHAVADIKISDIIASSDVHPVVDSFFALTGAVNHDGHFLPLLAVQFTELTDGFFVGCSFNHVVGDGSSFWHFFNTWAEIYRTDISEISRPPIIKRWFPESIKPPIHFPFTNPDELIKRAVHSLLRQKVLHFTAQSLAALKAKANEECPATQSGTISSFQALMAHLWISLTRARGLSIDKQTAITFAVDSRSRLKPPLSPDYFRNAMQGRRVTMSVGELIVKGIGWVAWRLHELIVAHDDSVIRAKFRSNIKIAPSKHVLRLNEGDITIMSSPRFNVYGVDFGWEKPVAVRNGPDNKLDGLIKLFPGQEGGGSVDLEIDLVPEVMKALESDNEFLDALSPSM